MNGKAHSQMATPACNPLPPVHDLVHDQPAQHTFRVHRAALSSPELFDLELVHEEVDSVSGIVLTLLGRPPRVGDSVRYDRLQLDVTAVKGHGVDEVAVTLRESEDAASD